MCKKGGRGSIQASGVLLQSLLYPLFGCGWRPVTCILYEYLPYVIQNMASMFISNPCLDM